MPQRHHENYDVSPPGPTEKGTTSPRVGGGSDYRSGNTLLTAATAAHTKEESTRGATRTPPPTGSRSEMTLTDRPEELFPYVRREVESYLQDTWGDPQTEQDVKDLMEQIEKDVESGVQGMAPCPGTDAPRSELISALVSAVHAMMDADRKVGPLKTLQGHMWRRAYADGTVKGHVYEDVLDALREWKDEGKDIVIYSSGSVEAQKLLFGHSCVGDLLHYFSHHFDTGVGAKVEAESYRNILKALKCDDPEDVIFLTDLPKEAWAAKEAGLKVILSVREGTAPLSTEDVATFPQVTSFSQLFDRPSSSSSSSSPRKKKICTEKQLEASQK